MLDGEVVETLWSPLNHTSSSARAMTWHHRQEYLDAHMRDSNWLKLVKMGMSLPSIQCSIWNPYHTVLYVVPTLYKKWISAKQQSCDAQDDFDSLCEAVGEESTKAWTNLEKELQAERHGNISAMGMFDVSSEEGKHSNCVCLS